MECSIQVVLVHWQAFYDGIKALDLRVLVITHYWQPRALRKDWLEVIHITVSCLVVLVLKVICMIPHVEHSIDSFRVAIVFEVTHVIVLVHAHVTKYCQFGSAGLTRCAERECIGPISSSRLDFVVVCLPRLEVAKRDIVHGVSIMGYLATETVELMRFTGDLLHIAFASPNHSLWLTTHCLVCYEPSYQHISAGHLQIKLLHCTFWRFAHFGCAITEAPRPSMAVVNGITIVCLAADEGTLRSCVRRDLATREILRVFAP